MSNSTYTATSSPANIYKQHSTVWSGGVRSNKLYFIIVVVSQQQTTDSNNNQSMQQHIMMRISTTTMLSAAQSTLLLIQTRRRIMSTSTATAPQSLPMNQRTSFTSYHTHLTRLTTHHHRHPPTKWNVSSSTTATTLTPLLQHQHQHQHQQHHLDIARGVLQCDAFLSVEAVHVCVTSPLLDCSMRTSKELRHANSLEDLILILSSLGGYHHHQQECSSSSTTSSMVMVRIRCGGVCFMCCIYIS